jgi:tetratricopeptide (TPR) repeat protein
MTAPTPQSKKSELINSLNQMVIDGVNDVRMEEIITEANKMKNGQYVDAHIVLGIVASLRGNVDEVHRLFNIAIASGGREVSTLNNYAISLSNLGDIPGAIELIDEAIEMAPDNISLLEHAIDLHMVGFDTTGARKMINKLKLLGEVVEETQLFNQMNEIDAIFASAGTNWMEVANRIKVAASAILHAGKRPKARWDIYDGIVFFRFLLNSTVEDVTKTESTMIDAIANEPFTPADRVLSISCGVA